MKRVLLLFTVLLATLTFAQVPSYVPTNGLVGWWGFNGNANDESGNGNNGTVNGTVLTTDRFGNPNSAYSFDGINNHIQIQPSSSLNNFNNAITISVWLYNVGQSGNASYGNQDLQGIFGPATWLINDGGFLFRLLDSNFDGVNNRVINYANGLPNVSISSNSIVNMNIWENIICSYDGNLLKIFRNGVLSDYQVVGSGLTSSLNTTGRYYTIGQCIDWASPSVVQSFNGKLDDIGIWNRALTECEIQDLYNAGLNSIISVTQIGTQLTADQNNATYQWIDCDNNNSPISGETNQSYTPTATGSYAVEVSMNGCVDTSSCFLVDYTSIEELFQNEKVLVKIIDFLGRETIFRPNTPLIFIYSDGTRERVMQIEE